MSHQHAAMKLTKREELWAAVTWQMDRSAKVQKYWSGTTSPHAFWTAIMMGVPSGRVHNLINIAAYAALASGVLFATRQELVVVTQVQMLNFTLGFMAGTFLLSPDLDLSEGHVDSKRHWGLLGFLWVPYGMIFSHRGLSHTWVLGPLTRIAYVAVMIALIVGLIRSFAPDVQLPRIPQPISMKFLLPIILGYYLSQWLHLIADGVRPDHGMRHTGKKVKHLTRARR